LAQAGRWDQCHARAPAAQTRRFLGRVIHHNHAVDTGVRRPLDELRAPHPLDRVRVTHEHHRGVGIGTSKLAHPLQHIGQTDTQGERLFT